jgi:RND family efflux transporter MFP subunit
MRATTINFRSATMVLTAVLVSVLMGMPAQAQPETLQGITAPNADITLSFVVPGRVSDVLVKEGHAVQKGQVLVRLYDEPERIQCEQLKMLSEDRTKILAAEAELEQKKVDLKKLEMARAKGAASDWEVEHLRLNVRIANLSRTSALLEREQYRQRYSHAKSQLARMHLIAPIEGLIEDVGVEIGESIGTLGPVIRLVQNDPLHIDVPVPMAEAADLKVGQETWIYFPGSNRVESPNARIINIATVADAASDTLRVRIEVPNPMRRPAGERVSVAFSDHEKKNNLAQLKTEP